MPSCARPTCWARPNTATTRPPSDHQLAQAGRGTLAEIDRLLQILPTAETGAVSWRDYGDVILCDSYDEMLKVANDMASEHVQVMTDRDDWFLENMHLLRRAVPRARAPMSPMATR
jgi:hypothetical protein